MPRYVSRSYAGAADLPSLVTFAQQLARPPRPSYYHPGDFVWQLYALDNSDDVRLWTHATDGALVACAIFEPPLTFQFALRADVEDDRGLASDVLRWVEQRRSLVPADEDIPLAYQGLGSHTLSTFVLDSDGERIALLTEHGYVRAQPAGIRFSRDLDNPLPPVILPDGARFRRMTDHDANARSELHRNAWSVWGESKFSAALYSRLRAAPLYDAELDVVVEHGGTLASYCVCWLDSANAIGYFEPVGTRRSATGLGLGRAVMREGMRRLREKGMRTALVGTAEVNRPAAALYQSAGFTIVDREHFYVKPVATTARDHAHERTMRDNQAP